MTEMGELGRKHAIISKAVFLFSPTQRTERVYLDTIRGSKMEIRLLCSTFSAAKLLSHLSIPFVAPQLPTTTAINPRTTTTTIIVFITTITITTITLRRLRKSSSPTP